MLELADNNYEISMINILSHGNNGEYKQKNRGHWQQRNGNPKKNMQKKILLKKKTTIIETKNSLIGPITKSRIARGKINGP